MDAVLADSQANLLRTVVVVGSIEHVELLLVLDDCRSLATLSFPIKSGLKYGSIERQSPVGATEISSNRSRCNTKQLTFELRVASSEIEEIFALVSHDLGIDGPATIPGASRSKDGVRGVPDKSQAIGTPSMTNGIGPAPAISLIEEVDGVVPDQSSGSTKSLRLVVGLRCYLAYPFPVLQVLALSNADIPAFPVTTIVRRDAVIHQISATMTDHNGVFRKERTGSCVVAINELVGKAERTDKQKECQQKESKVSHLTFTI